MKSHGCCFCEFLGNLLTSSLSSRRGSACNQNLGKGREGGGGGEFCVPRISRVFVSRAPPFGPVHVVGDLFETGTRSTSSPGDCELATFF